MLAKRMRIKQRSWLGNGTLTFKESKKEQFWDGKFRDRAMGIDRQNNWREASNYEAMILMESFLDGMFYLSLSFLFLIIIVLEVHCDIYKSSTNISYLNLTPPSLFPLLYPHSCNSFNRLHFFCFHT
jgi:hypothetical protein